MLAQSAFFVPASVWVGSASCFFAASELTQQASLVQAFTFSTLSTRVLPLAAWMVLRFINLCLRAQWVNSTHGCVTAKPVRFSDFTGSRIPVFSAISCIFPTVSPLRGHGRLRKGTRLAAYGNMAGCVLPTFSLVQALHDRLCLLCGDAAGSVLCVMGLVFYISSGVIVRALFLVRMRLFQPQQYGNLVFTL